jgi:hypothetical protein
MPKDAVALAETRDGAADLDDLARDVLAENGWIVQGVPGRVLHLLVDRVDGQSRVLDDDLILTE